MVLIVLESLQQSSKVINVRSNIYNHAEARKAGGQPEQENKSKYKIKSEKPTGSKTGVLRVGNHRGQIYEGVINVICIKFSNVVR